MRAAIGLDTMGEGVKTGSRGDEFRHADRQFRIGDHDAWQHFRMEDDLLHMCLRVGDDAGTPDLGPGAGGRRHRDDRGDGVGIGTGPPVADILEIPDRPGLAGHESHHLSKVETRPAAKGDHTIMATGLIGGDACRQIDLVRVRVNIGEQRIAEPGCRHDLARPAGNRQPGEPPVRDKQGA